MRDSILPSARFFSPRSREENLVGRGQPANLHLSRDQNQSPRRSGRDSWQLSGESQQPHVLRKSHRSESGKRGKTDGQPEQPKGGENRELQNVSLMYCEFRPNVVAVGSRLPAANPRCDQRPGVRCDPETAALTERTFRCIAAGLRHTEYQTPDCFFRNH